MDLNVSAGTRILVEKLEVLLRDSSVPPETQKMLIFAVENSVEYFALCSKYSKKPGDPKVLYDFLYQKGKITAKMAVDDLACAVALVQFLENLRHLPMIKGGPVPAVWVVSMTLLDMLAIGNSCVFMQEAYYHAFEKTSSVRLVPTRPTNPAAFLASLTPQDKMRCESERHLNDTLKIQAIQRSMP